MTAGNGQDTKAVLFDLDGTLVDSDPIHIAVFIDFLGVRGISLTETEYKTTIHGRQNVDIFRDILPHEDPHEMDLAKEAAYRARIGERMDPMPGARDLVGALRTNGWKLAVVTNAPRDNLDAVLQATSLGEHFDFTISSNEVTHGKPDPELYLRALDALGASAARSLVFEDSPSGIRAAIAAKLKVIGVTSSLTPGELRSAGATDTITDFTDAALKRHLTLPEGALS